METSKILRWISLSAIFLVPFVILIVSMSMFFPFITGKNFAFRILVELAFGSWIILALRDQTYRPKVSLVLKSLLIFVVIIGVADVFGYNPYKSFCSNFERMEGWIGLAHLFMYFIVAGTMLSTSNLWKRFLQTIVVVSLIEAIYGFVQLAGKITINQGGDRLDGTFGNATYLAVFMLGSVFITAFLLLRERWSKWMQGVYGVVMLIQLYVLYSTATRGAIVGLFAGVLVFLALVAIFDKERIQLRKWSRIALASIAVLVFAFVLMKNTNFVQNSNTLSRIASISFSELKTRSMVWNMALKGFTERPILGYGQENFNFVFNKHYDPRMYAQEQWFDRTHNILFDWLVAGGILGLLSYLSILFAFIFSVWNDSESSLLKKIVNKFKTNTHIEHLSFSEKSLLIGFLAAYFVQNLFVFDNLGSYILFFTLLAYAHFLTARSMPGYLNRKMELNGNARQVVSVVVVLAVIFSLYFANIKPIMAGRALIGALSAREANSKMEYFKKAISYGTFADSEIREQLPQTAISVSKSGVDVSLKREFFELAKAELQKQIDQTGGKDARYLFFMGNFFYSYGYYDLADTYLSQALELSPLKQSILFQYGASLVERGKYEEAFDVFKKAYDIYPAPGTPLDLYALAAVYVRKDDLVEQLLVPEYGTVLRRDDMFIEAYYKTKQYDKVIAIWKLKVESNPEDSKNYIGLGAAYLSDNQRQKAIEVIQQAIKLDSDFKETGEYYIREIRAGRNP